MVPTLSASSAIAGVSGWLSPALAESRNYWTRPRAREVRAYWYILFWIGMQFSSVLTGASDGVAYWAHIGGFIGGMAIGTCRALDSACV